MDKFIVQINDEKKEIKLNDKLYDIIYKFNGEEDDSENKLENWNKMIKRWYLIKYNKNINNKCSNLCSCQLENKICISNGKEQLMICHLCLELFPAIDKIYENIDKMIYNILHDIPFEKIRYGLLHFLNLQNDTVDKYNKNGIKNRRNQKIYTMLCKISEYHISDKEFRNKLNSIYTKISRIVEIDEILDRVENALLKIKFCNKCSPLNQCLICFKKNNEHLVKENITNEQMKVLWKVFRHIFNDKKLKYGLYGSAGTGKTTLIKYILQLKHLNDMFVLKELRDLFNLNYHNFDSLHVEKLLDTFSHQHGEKKDDKKYQISKEINALLVDILHGDKVIVLASPTNKALDVIREKVNSIKSFNLQDSFTGQINDIKVIFFTISKLLTYHRFLDKNHNMFFKRGKQYINIIDRYNLVIIDESSMVNKDNIRDINNDITDYHKIKLPDYNKYSEHCKGFVLFTGDRAQLPPPKESFSAVFRLPMNKTELETVMRTDKENIVKLSNFIRQWIFNDKANVREELLSHGCEYINFYQDQNKFIENFCKNNDDSIILAWTNETCNNYNKKIREILFGNVTNKRFFVGEHLIFNNFYKLKTKNDDKLFYSSMPIIIRDIQIDNNFLCEQFSHDNIINKINERMKNDIYMIDLFHDTVYNVMNAYIKKFIDMFNHSMNSIFKVWVLYFFYKGIKEEYPIYVIYHKKIYIKSIEQGKRYIKDYFEKDNKHLNDNLRNSLREVIVEFFDQYYIQPFASLEYGYAMTCDKSQGSGYSHIYVDAPDILDQNRYPFLDIVVAKQRFYTAITRASHGVNILI